jgi:hypothetical protein
MGEFGKWVIIGAGFTLGVVLAQIAVNVTAGKR